MEDESSPEDIAAAREDFFRDLQTVEESQEVQSYVQDKVSWSELASAYLDMRDAVDHHCMDAVDEINPLYKRLARYITNGEEALNNPSWYGLYESGYEYENFFGEDDEDEDEDYYDDDEDDE